MTYTEASTPPGERGTCAALFRRPTAAAFTSWVRQLSRSLGREAGVPSPCGAYGHAWRWVGLPGSEPKQRLNRSGPRWPERKEPAVLRVDRGWILPCAAKFVPCVCRERSAFPGDAYTSVKRNFMYTARYLVPLPLPTALSNGIATICTQVKEGRL